MEDFKHHKILDSGFAEQDSPWDGIEYAGFWQRVLASIIDGVLITFAAFVFLFAFIFLIDSPFSGFINSSFIFLAYLVIPGYKIFMEGKYGATLGKMALRLKIVDRDAQPIDMGQAFRRYALYGLSFVVAIMIFVSFFINSTTLLTVFTQLNSLASIAIFLSCLFVAFDDRKQSLHDKIANTYVVKNNGEGYGGGFS